MNIIYRSLLLLSFMLPAHAEQFQSSLTDTQWQLNASALHCSLSQTIPNYGEAGFYQSNGQALHWQFKTHSQAATKGDITFAVTAALWQNDASETSITQMNAEPGQRLFEVEGLVAQQALEHLKEGRSPFIQYPSQLTKTPIKVLMSTVHLSDYLPEFQQCLANLHPDTFDQVKQLTVYFGLEQSTLSVPAQKALTRLANYVKVDNSIQQIIIASHTDSHGRRRLNEPLSDARAIAVKDFLMQHAEISEQLISIRSYADFKPAVSNKTPLGRAKNRRTEITLIR